jgi:hypothetical protein
LLLAVVFPCRKATAPESPAVVRTLAEKFAAAHPDVKPPPSGRPLEEQYAAYFFMGLTSPRGGIWNAPALETEAYNQGQANWREHPAERDEILAGYGYLRIEAEGKWQTGFEVSRFIPIDRGTETWPMSSFGHVAWNELPGQLDLTFWYIWYRPCSDRRIFEPGRALWSSWRVSAGSPGYGLCTPRKRASAIGAIADALRASDQWGLTDTRSAVRHLRASVPRLRLYQTMGARQMTENIDLLEAERMVAQTECDDIDRAIAQIAADDADAKAKLVELGERRKIAGERLLRISTALTEARSGCA